MSVKKGETSASIAHRREGVLHAGHVLGARLLRHLEPPALLLRQQCDRRRHRLGEELRALAAAEHQQPERLSGIGGVVGGLGGFEHGRAAPDCR